MPKAQRAQGLLALTKICTCFKFMSQVGQNSASESGPNFSFQISTKRLAQNVDQSLATKSRPNFSLKILTKIQLQDFYQTSASKFLPKFSFKISTKLLPTRQSATVTTSTSFELASSLTRVISIKSQER